MREIFKRKEDNQIFNIEIEMDAGKYKEDYTLLFSVFIKYDGIDDSTYAYEEFLETKCVGVVDENMPVSALYELYKQWSKVGGSLTKPLKMFKQVIRGKRFKLVDKAGIKKIVGLWKKILILINKECLFNK